MKEKRVMIEECWRCEYRRDIPDVAKVELGNSHISCIEPDVNMTGPDSGSFNYPYMFDPALKTKLCINFKEVE